MPLESFTKSDSAITVMWTLDMEPAGVWEKLTDAQNLAAWLGAHRAGAFHPGSRLRVDHSEGYLSESEILSVEPPHRLSMTWVFPDEPASRISITITATDPVEIATNPAAKLHLEHCDLGDLVHSYLPGWVTHLSYFEASLTGHPLPPQSFWPLYASFDRLLR